MEEVEDEGSWTEEDIRQELRPDYLGPFDLDSLKATPQVTLDGQQRRIPLYLLEYKSLLSYPSLTAPNLCVLDATNIVYAAGSFIVIYTVNYNEYRFLPTLCGGGIGHINVHPQRRYFAVAENGKNPTIDIFEYPSLILAKILRSGTELSFAFVDFSPDGQYLAAQGGPPDYTISIWDWEKQRPLLRSASFTQDIFQLGFSPFLTGILTTSGASHIKFWKMAYTFTGLKLQGEIGKFGKAEYSDIYSFVQLPDGKVVSSSESGIIYLWEEASVKAQVLRSPGKPCHQGRILQFYLDEGDLYTLGADGWIRTWDVEIIDNADPEEEAGEIYLEPLDEKNFKKESKTRMEIRYMFPSLKKGEKNFWLAQDLTGQILKLDLSFTLHSKPPQSLFKYPGSSISALSWSAKIHCFAVGAMDGSVTIYDGVTGEKICSKIFTAGVTALKWLAANKDNRHQSLVMGFEDGVLRYSVIASTQMYGLVSRFLFLRQAFRPHKAHVLAIALNHAENTLFTSGADSTIFFFDFRESLVPIGFVKTAAPLVWMFLYEQVNPNTNINQEYVVGGSQSGHNTICELPKPAHYEVKERRLTYLLPDLIQCTFTSKKLKWKKGWLQHWNELLRKNRELQLAILNRELEEEEQEAEEEELEVSIADEEMAHGMRPKVVLSVLKHGEPTVEGEMSMVEAELEVEESSQLMEASKVEVSVEEEMEEEEMVGEEMEEEEERQIPLKDDDVASVDEIYVEDSETNPFFLRARAEPDTILDYHHVPPHTLYLIMAPPYGQFLFQCFFTKRDIHGLISNKFLRIDVALYLHRLIYIPDMEEHAHVTKMMLMPNGFPYAIFGQSNGVVSVHLLDLGAKTLTLLWKFGYHDSQLGYIAQLTTSFDFRLIASSTKNNELFLFKFNLPELEITQQPLPEEAVKVFDAKVPRKEPSDLDGSEAPTLEESCLEAQRQKILKEMKTMRQQIIQDVQRQRLLMANLIRENLALPENSRLDYKYCAVHPLIRAAMQDKVRKEEQIIHKQLAWELEWHNVLQRKMLRFFSKNVETDLVETKAFYSEERLATFRSKSYKEVVEELNLDESDELDLCLSDDELDAGMKEEAEIQDLLEQIPTPVPVIKDVEGQKYIRMVVKRQMRQSLRFQQWKQLQTFKPKPLLSTHGHPVILRAQRTIGDYKLKTDSNYVVPKELRMNSKIKGRQLKAVYNKTHQIKKRFNDKVLALKAFRDKLPQTWKKDITRLFELSKRFHNFPVVPIANTLVDEEVLEEKTERILHEIKGTTPHQVPKKTKPTRSVDFVVTLTQTMKGTLLGTKKFYTLEEMPRLELTPLEIKLADIKRIKEEFEMDHLAESLQRQMLFFDLDLHIQRVKRSELALEVKNAFQYISLYSQEMDILRNLDAEEKDLMININFHISEKREMEAQVQEIQALIENKADTLAELQGKEQNILIEFHKHIDPDTHPFHDLLLKIVRKKSKKAEQEVKERPSAEMASASSFESSESGEWMEDMDEEAEMLDDTVCPPGCPPDDFALAVDLQLRKQELADIGFEIQRDLEALRKDFDVLLKKAKAIDVAAQSARKDMKGFQIKKQRQLNALSISLSLPLSQLLASQGVSLQDYLVFSTEALENLKRRTLELHKDNLDEQEKQCLQNTQMQRLRFECGVLRKRIEHLKAICEENMRWKFKGNYNLYEIEALNILPAEFGFLEKKWQANMKNQGQVLAKRQRALKSKAERLIEVTRENTKYLQSITVLKNELFQIEKYLYRPKKYLPEI